MKSSKNLAWSELKLGAVLVVSVILLGVGILQLGGEGGLFDRHYTLYMNMENTLGIKIGATVRLMGLQVGNVEEITLPDNHADRNVVLTLSMLEKYKDRIREDSTVTIKSLGLLGDKYIDLTVGSTDSRVLEDGDTFSQPAEFPISNVLASASTGIEGLNAVMEQLRMVLGDVNSGEGTIGHLLKDPKLYHDLDKAVADLDAVVADLYNAKGTIGKLIREPELYNNLLSVSAKADQVADSLNKGSLVKLSDDPEFYKNLRDVSDNLNDISTSAKNLVRNLETGNIARLSEDKELHRKVQSISVKLDSVIAKIENGEGTAAKLINDKELYDNMNSFFRNADALVTDVRENPDRYVNVSLF